MERRFDDTANEAVCKRGFSLAIYSHPLSQQNIENLTIGHGGSVISLNTSCWRNRDSSNNGRKDECDESETHLDLGFYSL
jgi:hypothetical protein